MRSFFILLLLFSSPSLYAQKVWTLDKCIEYAKENNIDIKSKRLEIELSKIDRSQAKWAYTPNLSLNNSFNISQGRVLDPTTCEFIETQNK